MSNDYRDKWPEMHMKHLELIQNAIIRMGTNSANLKNFSTLMLAAVISLATAIEQVNVLLFIIPIVVGFSVLDAKYLQLERNLRHHFDRVRTAKIDQQPSFLILPDQKKRLLSAYLSWSVIGFYGSITILLILLAFLIPVVEPMK